MPKKPRKDDTPAHHILTVIEDALVEGKCLITVSRINGDQVETTVHDLNFPLADLPTVARHIENARFEEGE